MKKQDIIIVIIALTITAILFGSYFLCNKFLLKNEPIKIENIEEANNIEIENKETKILVSDEQEVNDDFSLDDESGTAVVKGYAELRYLPDYAACGYAEDCGLTTGYVFFNIRETQNDNLLMFLNNNVGNSFVDNNAISLGCLIDDQIIWNNDSDIYGMTSFNMDYDNTQRLLASSYDNLVTIEINKEKLTFPSEAPSCYSMFTDIKLVEE